MNIGDNVSIVDGRSRCKATVSNVNNRYIQATPAKGGNPRVFGAKSLKERGGTATLVSLGGAK